MADRSNNPACSGARASASWPKRGSVPDRTSTNSWPRSNDHVGAVTRTDREASCMCGITGFWDVGHRLDAEQAAVALRRMRSEKRRVGEEGSGRWVACGCKTMHWE